MWLTIGLVLGGIIIGALIWVLVKGIKLTWYEWLMSVIGVVLLVFAIHNFVGALMENEPQASWMFLLVLGLPAVILLVISGQLAWRRHSLSS
jgi:uncharacterized membrane protein